MFCPKCRYEYIQGVYKCHECEIALVDQLPEKAKEKPATDSDLVPVYEPTNQADLALAKAMLEEEKIEYYIFNQATYYDMPRRPWVTVKAEDAERARQLLIDIADSRVDEADGEGMGGVAN
jgi:hypothetical protein